jgi:hypothetical protein
MLSKIVDVCMLLFIFGIVGTTCYAMFYAGAHMDELDEEEKKRLREVRTRDV